jgi:pimeloyl-ACP methyl ester carboxylesterase
VDPAVAAAAAAGLVPVSYASQTTPVTRAAWHDIPTSYVVCTQDAMLPPTAQEQMAARTERVHHLDASHSPMLSRAKELAALIRDEADGITNPTGAFAP